MPDKFKIIITLRRAQKFGDTGPYKNFDFLFNRLPAAIFFTEWIFTMFPNGNSRRITVNVNEHAAKILARPHGVSPKLFQFQDLSQ